MTWRVLDYDGVPLPIEYDTEEAAVNEGLCGRYLFSGFDVVEEKA